MRAPRTGSTGLWNRVAIAVAVCAALAVAVAPAGAAPDYSNRIGITLGGGAYKLVGGNVDHTKIGPWAQVGLRWGWRDHWDIESTYRYGFNWDDTQTFRCTTPGLDLGVLYSLNPDSRFTLQGLGGTGVLWWNVDDFRGQASSGLLDSGREAVGFREDGNGAHLNDSNWKVYGGLGFEYWLTWHLSFRGIARIDYLIKQSTDTSGASDSLGAYEDPSGAFLAQKKAAVDANDWMPSFAFNLTWFFGERDGDRDGVPNRSDLCPADPEDADGFQDEDGCPDLDNDGDAVPDVQDKCPMEAEDKDGFQDEDGCPDADNDGDGIADAQDQCPKDAEDQDNFRDEDGCPDPDNDGDAVADSLDQCPDTPAGSRVDEKGCPLSEREVQMLDTGMIRLSNVQFATGKADIVPETAAVLDEVGAVLAKWPMLEVEIGGHTDARGSEASNQALSHRRAQAVLDYLKSKLPDLDASKYTVKGYGESVPIADNKTAEGQAQNRRVEFKALNLDALRQQPPSP